MEVTTDKCNPTLIGVVYKSDLENLAQANKIVDS